MLPLFIIKSTKATQLVYHDHCEILKCNLHDWFHTQCLSHGTTLKGTMDALRFHLKVRQRIPVCLSVIQETMYFPLNLQDCEIWILYHPIHQVKKSQLHTLLSIHDITLRLPLDNRVVKRQLSRCKEYLDSFKRFPKLTDMCHVKESLVSHYLL